MILYNCRNLDSKLSILWLDFRKDTNLFDHINFISRKIEISESDLDSDLAVQQRQMVLLEGGIKMNKKCIK